MYSLDNTDQEILEILRKDGRASYSKIAEEVHLSRVAVRDRINTMMDNGIILGFTAIIDAKAMQKNAGVYMDIEVEPKKIHAVAHALMALPEIAIVSQHTGTTGLHVHAYIDDTNKVSKYMEDHVYTIDGVKNVTVQLLIHQYKTNSYLARYQE